MNTQIENELGRTREMHEFVVDQLAGQYPSDDRRDLFARFLSIAQSHHEAIMTLCFQERLIGSAYALFRPLVEATNRGLFAAFLDRKSTRLNSSHLGISYAVFCL